jgi:elongation factor P hydroxylase
MILVMLHSFKNNTDTPCVVTETKEKAVEWIRKEMEGYDYNNSCHQIREIEMYK